MTEAAQSNIDTVAADILADQRSQAQNEAAQARARIAIATSKAKSDPQLAVGKWRVFKNTMLNSQFVTRAGKYIQFPNGVHTTQDPADIAELEYEISKKHPNIHMDPNMMYVDHEINASETAEKTRMREEIRAELIRDMGFTPQGGSLQGIKNSDDVGVLSQGSNVNAKVLAALKALPKATG